MEVSEEEYGGMCVSLRPGDDLGAIPRSHRRLITPAVKAWWPDPLRAARAVADCAPVPNMATWFRRVADAENWRLDLHVGSSPENTQAGFWLEAPDLRGAEVAPPDLTARSVGLPPTLAAYYRLVGHVDWMGFGSSGGLNGPERHMSLAGLGHELIEEGVNPTQAFAFGRGPGGSPLFYTRDGRAGWAGLGGGVDVLGTVEDVLDWVYGKLLAKQCPDRDWSWSK